MSIDDGLTIVPERRRPTGAGAKVEAFRAHAEVARACLSGTLGALDAAFSSGGVVAAVAELETSSGQCRSAASP
jgi:hypothetical protein